PPPRRSKGLPMTSSYSPESLLLDILDEQLLPAAVRALDDAVFALTKTQVLRVGGEVFTSPCLWAELKQAVNSGQKGQGEQKFGGSFRSTPSAWIAGLDLATQIERTVAEWSGVRGHTLELLVSLPRLAYRPQDTQEVYRRARIVQGWAEKIEKMLSGDWFEISPGGCTQCGADKVEVLDDLGETVQKPAVTVTPLGMNCAACLSHWTPTQLLELALIVAGEEAA
ncbi:hypothetical protein QT969_10520, partial [Rhodococcus sp. CSLK01-03]